MFEFNPLRDMFYTWLFYGWIGLAGVSFVALRFIPASYGKFTRAGWGPSIHRSLGWVAMELPAVGVILFLFVTHAAYTNLVYVVFLSVWQLHYINRTFVFPFRMRGKKTSISASTVLFGLLFNLVNGYFNGHYLFAGDNPLYGTGWLSDPRFLVGLGVFIVGFGINIHSDELLRALRKPGETGYKIPRGGMFRYVSAANYLGELVEWAGWAILTWSPVGFAFFIWTGANLIPRALSQHHWYVETFSEYPQNRKAIIPFLV